MLSHSFYRHFFLFCFTPLGITLHYNKGMTDIGHGERGRPDINWQYPDLQQWRRRYFGIFFKWGFLRVFIASPQREKQAHYSLGNMYVSRKDNIKLIKKTSFNIIALDLFFFFFFSLSARVWLRLFQ